MSATDLPAGVTEDAAVQYVSSKIDANLAHLFQESAVPIGLQYKIGQQFKTVRAFASYEDSRSKVRDAMKSDFSLDGSANLAARSALAAVVSTWEACQRFAEKEAELKAEARVLGIPRPVAQTDRSAMKSSFESAFGAVEESLEPSDEYLASKLEEIEAREPCASPLSEVISKRNAKTMGIQTTVDHSGAVRIVRSKQKGSLPQGTEELRTILKVEGNTWCFLSAKFRNREILRNMRPSCWEEYTNFLLGERCYLMKIHGGKGGADAAPLRPPWHILLSFEFELRKEAIKRAVKDNTPICETLLAVCKDPELKERFFTSPIALQPQALEPGFLKRAWSGNGLGKGNGWPSDVPFNKWGRKGKEKGNPKGFKGFFDFKGNGKKGKGKTKQTDHQRSANSLIDRTPDGREVCFAFNAQGCDGSCGRVHICRVRGCGEAHAMWEHFQRLSIKDSSSKKDAN